MHNRTGDWGGDRVPPGLLVPHCGSAKRHSPVWRTLVSAFNPASYAAVHKAFESRVGITMECPDCTDILRQCTFGSEPLHNACHQLKHNCIVPGCQICMLHVLWGVQEHGTHVPKICTNNQVNVYKGQLSMSGASMPGRMLNAFCISCTQCRTCTCEPKT